jgi:signal transduction histidine kinase
MVAVIDPDSYVVQFQNETGLEKLGDLSGRKCYETIGGCPLPCSFCKLPEAIKTGRVTANEVPLPNNRHLLVQWSKAVTDDGRLHVIETITDITEQKQQAEAARRADKMEALSRLAGGMAHDINNLLTVVVGASERVTTEADNGAPRLIQIQRMQNAVDRAAELMRRLVAFSHHQVLQPMHLDLNEVVRESESRVRALLGEGVKVELTLHDEPVPMLVDREQLDQAVTVLVTNARDAMPAGGTLTLATTTVTVGEETAVRHHVNSGDYVRFCIRDTGHGISAEMLAHLFEPFYVKTGEATGRGLGLASVYGIVRQSGGFIEVTSGSGAGTVFTISFPRSEPSSPAKRRTLPDPVSVNDPTILLVEDDQDVRLAVSDMLKTEGFCVEEACDGVEALRLLHDMTSPPHLVLTDVMMPRMTGPQLAAQIEAATPGIHILYMSGYSDQILQSADGRRPAFIAKPFSGRELIRAVREALAR